MPLRETKWTPRESKEAFFERVLSKLRHGYDRAEQGIRVEIRINLGYFDKGHVSEPRCSYVEPD